jgi:hypothetical protein
MTAPKIFGFRVRDYIRQRCCDDDRGHATPCWVWGLALKGDGYATGKPPGFTKVVRIARAAYEAFIGPIPSGLEIDHLCQQRECCNPDHLEAVTHAENMARQAGCRTSCRRGHPFDGDNLYIFPNGARTCRTCKIEGERARQLRNQRVAA